MLRHQCGGYTIVELMSIVVVMIVLISLLVPMYQEVRQAARTTSCAHNLHQISLAAVDHKIEHRHRLPLRAASWPGQLATYLHGKTKLFICPSDETPDRVGPPLAAINVYDGGGAYLQTMLFQEGPMVLRTDLGGGRYRLDFEDIPGGGDRDFDDFIAEVTEVSGFGHRIHARRGTASYRFDLVNQAGDLIHSNVDAGGVDFELHGGTASYGMNQAADTLPNHIRGASAVLMLDYEKISAVVRADSAFRDDWAAWVDAAGRLSFARHHGKINVLGLGGEVRTTGVHEIDPRVAGNLGRWLPGYVEP